MSNASAKELRERKVFEHFLKERGMQNGGVSFVSRKPPEPDILCTFPDGVKVAFELSEICDKRLAEMVNRRDTRNGQYLYTSDPTREVVEKKIDEHYVSEHPVELIHYWAGRTISTDDIISPQLKERYEGVKHSYQRVWYLGEIALELIYESL